MTTTSASNLGTAVFDLEVTRIGLMMITIIGEADNSCWKSYETFAKEIQKRAELKKAPGDKAVQNNLSIINTRGYVRSSERVTPEAGNAKLTHRQIAVIEDGIKRELGNVVDFKSRHSGINHPAPAGFEPKSRSSGTSIDSSFSKKSLREARTRAVPELAGALRASGQFVMDAFNAVKPSPTFEAHLRAKYPDADPAHAGELLSAIGTKASRV
jgi:hypothetical protein